MTTNYVKIFTLFIISSFLINCNSTKEEIKSPKDYVNPFIGTGGHGHTYPGATVPFGMVQLSPDTRLEGWDGCSGYHYSDSVIYGFSHTHLSGTGVGDYGDVLLMPTQGKVKFDNGYQTGFENGYASSFKKSSEHATPGYYMVHLDEHNIDVKLTATERVGIHQYTFNSTDTANIILDLTHRDKPLDYNIKIVNNKEIEGFRISSAWAKEQHIYFVIQFSSPFVDSQFNEEKKQKAAFRFSSNSLMVKVGISAVSIEGARKNLQSEAPHWNFEKYKNAAETKWEEALNKIIVESDDEVKKEIFYTALYHTMLVPNLFSDVDGKYRGMDLKIHHSSKPIYTVFSLWDTFRATHPLYTIIEQDKTNLFIQTFLKHYKDGGKLPIWELAANYTGCMIGYHAIPVIVDAFIKGIQRYDEYLALKAMLNSANSDELGLWAYKSKGFIESVDELESVSKTLEYAYDDWCIAQMAKALKKDSIYKIFIKRSQHYKNLFNPETGFMQSKINGGWSEGFDPTEVNFNFTEANSWQYSFFVPHDIKGLIHLYGGNKELENKLDELFSTTKKLTGRHQSDITGLIGQYAHGNEPSHHMAYLYDFIEKPYKTQEKVHQILTGQYSNKPDGLSGNEDCGQMSAWYVLSAMGFYSVTPGLNYYAIGTPLFDKVTINLENGKKFSIIAKNISDKNKYIQSATLNGVNWNKSVLYHNDIVSGGELIFEMGDHPNKTWGTENVPVPYINKEDNMIPVPYTSISKQSFTDSVEIVLKSIDKEAAVYYSINDSGFELYQKPIKLYQSAAIKYYTQKEGIKSYEVVSKYTKLNDLKKIKILTPYDNQYNGGGPDALIDGLKGGNDFRTGFWQGFQGKDVEVIIDLGEQKKFQTVTIGAFQDINSWIWFPKSIEISVSPHPTGQFKKSGVIKNDFPDDKFGAFRKDFIKKFPVPIRSRYVKIKFKYYGVIPEWHLGKGHQSWIFLDEITVE